VRALARALAHRGARGRCPRCRSGRVRHLVFGMPTYDALRTAPAWVSFAGPAPSGETPSRRCQECGHGWVPAGGRGRPGDR
jgi:hypothetical protein